MKKFPDDPRTVLGAMVLFGRCTVWICVYIPFLIFWAILEEVIHWWFRATGRRIG